MSGAGDSDYSPMTPPSTPGSAAQEQRLAFEKTVWVEHEVSNLVSWSRCHLYMSQLPLLCYRSLLSSPLTSTWLFVSTIRRNGTRCFLCFIVVAVDRVRPLFQIRTGHGEQDLSKGRRTGTEWYEGRCDRARLLDVV